MFYPNRSRLYGRRTRDRDKSIPLFFLPPTTNEGKICLAFIVGEPKSHESAELLDDRNGHRSMRD